MKSSLRYSYQKRGIPQMYKHNCCIPQEKFGIATIDLLQYFKPIGIKANFAMVRSLLL